METPTKVHGKRMCHGDQTQGLHYNGVMPPHRFGRELVNTALSYKRRMEIKTTYAGQWFLLAIGFLDLRVLGNGSLRIKVYSPEQWP